MLGGQDPLIIFSIFKKILAADVTKSKLPLAGFVQKLALPPIPIYLREDLTGLYIDTEEKNIDIDTNTDTLNVAADPNLQQKALGSLVKISLLANKNSIGLSILSACADLVLPLVTSGEYSITYVRGVTTIFGGLLHSFSITQDSNTDLSHVTIELINASKKPSLNSLSKDPKSIDLNNVGTTPTRGGGPVTGGSTPIVGPG